MGLMDILNQVLTSGTASDQHVDQVVQSVPSDALAAGLAHAFRSDQTPEIGAMVAQMFGNSNGQQQAGMLKDHGAIDTRADRQMEVRGMLNHRCSQGTMLLPVLQ